MSSPCRSKSAFAETVSQNIIKLLEERGIGDYIGESISQLEHCLQCAHFAVQAGQLSLRITFYYFYLECVCQSDNYGPSGSPDEMVIAALLHDIGQLLPEDQTSKLEISINDTSVGRTGHEKIGEEYLRRLGFAESVNRLVGSHVAAKRSFYAFLSIDLIQFCFLQKAKTHS